MFSNYDWNLPRKYRKSRLTRSRSRFESPLADALSQHQNLSIYQSVFNLIAHLKMKIASWERLRDVRNPVFITSTWKPAWLLTLCIINNLRLKIMQNAKFDGNIFLFLNFSHEKSHGFNFLCGFFVSCLWKDLFKNWRVSSKRGEMCLLLLGCFYSMYPC